MNNVDVHFSPFTEYNLVREAHIWSMVKCITMKWRRRRGELANKREMSSHRCVAKGV